MSDQVVVFTFSGQEERLDKFLVACMPQFSRSRIQKLIDDGRVWVSGVEAKKSGQFLSAGESVRVEVPPPEPVELEAEDIPLNVVFENSDVVVVDKPAGMVVHPAPGHRRGTLANAVLAHAPDIEGVGGKIRPGIVHRLDKDTSGLILVAKNDSAHRMLQKQFRKRAVHKVYLALVDGRPPTPRGRIEAPVGRDPNDRKRMTVVPPTMGRAAVTEYYTQNEFEAHTVLDVHPVTGRTHQIRVHLAYIKCPVVGDRQYGYSRPTVDLDRQFLHAARLTIRLPGEEEPRTFEAPLPEDLQSVLNEL